MSKKYTYEYVKEYIENIGYKLLSSEYTGVKNKLLIECDKGHKFEMSFDSILRGYKCPECKGNKKLSYEYVKEYIESYGYKLVSKEYKNSRTKLKMICNKGHECEINWDNFKYGRRCKKCAKEKQINNLKLSYDEVKDYIEKQGYILLSKKYINNQEKLHMKCDKGHDVFMAFASFKSGRRCKTCSYKEMGEKRKMHYEDVKKYIESFGYELISKEYVNINDPLKIKCPYGYEYELSFNNFKNNNKCPYINPTRKKTLEEVKNEFAKEGYEVLSEEYINSKQKLKVKCDKGHIIYMTRNDFLEGSRCKICNMSKGERKIEKLLKSNNINFIFDQPYFDDLLSPYGNPLRPDFIIPDRKIWIEYDGEFHYKNCYEEDGHEKITINDKIKNKYAKENNWKLIRIPYWEFENINKILEKELKL